MNNRIKKIALACILLVYATLSQAIELDGVIQYERVVELGVPVSGVVSKVMADEGQSVQKNDRLLELEETPFIARLEKLDADLRLLKAEHGAVAKELARDRELYERMVLSTVSLDGTQLKMVRTDSLLQAKQAEQKLAKYELEKSRLEAPFAGKIIERLVEPGQSIRADMQSPVLFRLADTSSFIVEAEVTGDKIAVLKHGASLEVRIQGRIYNAVVKSSSLLAPARSLAQPARYLVKLKLDAADDGFFPGQPAALILSGIAEQ